MRNNLKYRDEISKSQARLQRDLPASYTSESFRCNTREDIISDMYVRDCRLRRVFWFLWWKPAGHRNEWQAVLRNFKKLMERFQRFVLSRCNLNGEQLPLPRVYEFNFCIRMTLFCKSPSVGLRNIIKSRWFYKNGILKSDINGGSYRLRPAVLRTISTNAAIIFRWVWW